MQEAPVIKKNLKITSSATTYINRIVRLWTLLAFCFACSFALAQSGSNAPPSASIPGDSLSISGFNDQPSSDIYPVDIMMNGLHLRIPRNYLTQGYVSNTTNEASITLLIHLPELGGATEKTVNFYHTPNWYHSPAILFVYISKQPSSAVTGAQRFIDKEKDMPAHKSIYGLTISQKISSFLYGYNKDLNRPFLFYCSSGPYSDLSSCRHGLDLSHGVQASIDYMPSLLPQWQSLDTKLNSLLNSFIVGE